MKIIRVQPVTSEDSEITLEFDGKHVYITTDIVPIVCSQEQADRLGLILRRPEQYFSDH